MMLQPSMDVYILPLSFVEYRVERRIEAWEVRGHHHAIKAVFIGADQYDSGETPPTEVKGHRTGGGLH